MRVDAFFLFPLSIFDFKCNLTGTTLDASLVALPFFWALFSLFWVSGSLLVLLFHFNKGDFFKVRKNEKSVTEQIDCWRWSCFLPRLYFESSNKFCHLLEMGASVLLLPPQDRCTPGQVIEQPPHRNLVGKIDLKFVTEVEP